MSELRIGPVQAPGTPGVPSGPCAIKIKAAGTKRFRFLTPDGGLDSLRVHAAQVPRDHAEVIAAKIRSDNPTATVKIVKL